MKTRIIAVFDGITSGNGLLGNRLGTEFTGQVGQ